MKVIVIGGGAVGRLFQHAWPDAEVFDWGPAPEGPAKTSRQYGAMYLWTPIPGISCREFDVVTHIDGAPATLETVLAYKAKIGKDLETRSGWARQFQTETKGYDFIDPLPIRAHWGVRAVEIIPERHKVVWSNGVVSDYDVLVSTIPLFSLIAAMPYSPVGKELKELTRDRLRFAPIYVKVTPRPPDAKYPLEVMYVNYLSDPDIEPYRYCDRNGERHYEGLAPMGTIPSKKFSVGKLFELDPEIDRHVQAQLNAHQIYNFGRFATWQSDELLHETWMNINQFTEALK